MLHPSHLVFGAASLALACLSDSAAALTAAEIFARVAPATGTVELLDADGAQLDLRSAVMVRHDRFVTVCEGLGEATSLKLTLSARTYDARIAARDGGRNLCALSIDGAIDSGTPLAAGKDAPSPGLRVFAISNALGLGVGISDGLIAGVRTFSGGTYIQFSAPVSPGSQGGALVDDEGRLLGIVEYRHRAGQNVNFAAPAAWIDDIDARAAADRIENERHETASTLVREARWTELNALASEWRSAAPESPNAWGFAAQAAENLGDMEQAVLAWQTLQRLAPDSDRASIGLGNVLLRVGRIDEAASLAETLVGRDRQDASAWLLLAQALHLSQKRSEAEAAYLRATKLDPWMVNAHAGLATLAHDRGDFSTAAAIWTRLSGLYPNHPPYRYRLVHAQLQAGQPERAYVSLARLPEAERQAAAAHYWTGITLRMLGRPIEAVEALRRGVAAAGPADSLIAADLAITLAQLQRYPEAIAAAEQAVQLAPDSRDAKYWLAVQLKDGGRAAEALLISTQLVSAEPSDPQGWRLHGFTLSLLGRRKEAIAALERSLELDPKQGKVWGALIEGLHAEDRQEAARRAYEQLRTVDPEYARTMYDRLIVTYEEQAQ